MNEDELYSITEGFKRDTKERSDVLANYFIIGYFITGLGFAFVYDTWTVAIGVGGLAMAAFYSAKLLLPQSDLYQYVLSAVLAVFMAQFIYQMHGLFEMHFFAFIGSAILITYQKWKLQIPMLALVVVHHLVFSRLQNSGFTNIYFSQTNTFDLWVFSIHIILAALTFFICGLWSHKLSKVSEKHIRQTAEVEKLKKQSLLSKQLQESEQRFSTLIQKGADLIRIFDLNEKITYVSSNFHQQTGYGERDLLGKKISSFMHPDDMERARQEGMKILTMSEVRLSPYRFQKANGEYLWFDTILTNLLDQPSIRGILCNTRDITESRIAELEREQMIKELTKSNADLKQFSFITSHNLRAPLSNIIGILGIVDQQSLNEHNSLMFDMLHKAAKQLNTTIDDLNQTLLIRRNLDEELTAVDLRPVFAEVKKLFAAALTDGDASIKTKFEVESIITNKSYLESIFINLISNAIKYANPQRRLVLNIECKQVDDNKVALTFADNGLGINLDRFKDRLFGMYQRFHSGTSGTGLGLFITKEQVAALGGQITIQSKEGVGTTFTIILKQQAATAYPMPALAAQKGIVVTAFSTPQPRLESHTG